jgi:hypothetical protein
MLLVCFPLSFILLIPVKFVAILNKSLMSCFFFFHFACFEPVKLLCQVVVKKELEILVKHFD